ncbi:hypothetical protein MUK71_16160 [Arthrobacter zhangbolii]|uniref:Uncharacterized protein n=1 Tax=Arthrobacter zhangbolii TaxID=2886936 RepID=A0ABY4DJ30_9MICC|nr:hypothetical protein [Arthrobacter zhangbolii]UON92087.1 hypothetical protein MUK71_16160 [Arthrobacter zhangbolii]
MSAPVASGYPVPSPSVIIGLIKRMVSERWPSGLEDLAGYFARLGCVLGPSREPDEDCPPGVARGEFFVPGVAVTNASWSALNSDLFTLTLFAYADSPPGNVDAGYDAIRTGLVNVFGPALDERTDPHGNRSAVWLVQEAVVELYAHLNLAPAVQAAVSHEGRTADFQRLIAQRPGHPGHPGY